MAAFLGAGGKYFDTARIYAGGGSEEMTGGWCLLPLPVAGPARLKCFLFFSLCYVQGSNPALPAPADRPTG